MLFVRVHELNLEYISEIAERNHTSRAALLDEIFTHLRLGSWVLREARDDAHSSA